MEYFIIIYKSDGHCNNL